MKKRFLIAAMAAVLTGGMAQAFGPPASSPAAGDIPYGQQQNRGNGNGSGMKGKRSGPQDGSGPIHPPGTGGGSGAGNRRGRK